MTYFERYNIDVTPPTEALTARVDPEIWRKSVENALFKIERIDAGKALLTNLTKSTNTHDPAGWIQIKQYSPQHHYQLVCNSETQPVRNFYGKSLRWHMATILHEPNQYHEGSRCYEKKHMGDPKQNRGKLPDEVLFHELIHGHRFALRLKGDDNAVGGSLFKYTSREEFIAVVITNIYISDTTNSNSSGLRGAHLTGQPLEPELADSIAFYGASALVYPILSKFADEEWPLFHALADVKARFNPLRALRENEEWVKAASESEKAKSRDKEDYKKAAKALLSPLAKAAVDILRR